MRGCRISEVKSIRTSRVNDDIYTFQFKAVKKLTQPF